MAVAKGELVEIFKARTDKREYRRIVLKNSLEVLLISDPDTDKCAASMDVRVGYFSDPEGLPGLAHFLEHMLFYASEKYPLEDSYSKYIAEHGGSTNAFTSSEQTNYYFDVNNDCFEEALDRFAQFFIKPLMSADATSREIKAVDSENRKNLLSDARRMDQLQKHLSIEGHPFHKFSTGNWDTLEVRPKARGLDTRQELFKFYEENYSANLMHLVVYGKENIDEIQNLVELKFQDIRNTERSCFRCPGEPCTSEHLQVLVRSVPIKEGHKLGIAWPITPEIHHYKEGPCRYLSHLIGHEGEGSLFYVLKTLGWATGLFAGEVDWTLEFSFFDVVIHLTDAGHEHMQDVVGLLFKYIRLLQQSGICKWIFDELSSVCETKFHYQDKVTPVNYAVHLACNMQVYPPRDWLVGSSLPSKFSPGTIQMALEELSIDNVRIFWESKKFEGHTDKVEPWYGTAYSVEKVTPSMIEEWMLCAVNDNLHLPAPNVFIPTDLSLKAAQEMVKFPVLLRKASCSRLWYKSDTMFSTPKAYVKIDFNCPHAGNSPEAHVLTDIFTRLLMDYLNEYAYYAKVAGLYYGINRNDWGFQVTLIGYNDKLRTLLETVLGKIAIFEVKTERFFVVKVHRDDFLLNVKLQLFALIAKQSAFHQLRSVEQLGYITSLMQRNDSGIYGIWIIIQSTVKGPGHIDLRVEAFLKTFESKLYEMTSDEFKNNVNALIDMKLEKHKNLKEESGFYWQEIHDGTLKFDRKELEVAALRQLTQQELIDFFNDHIKVGAPQRKSLSIGVYGNLHSSEYTADKSGPVHYSVKIDDIFSFRRSQPLYGSFRGVSGHVKL
ncbi:hypothetical protein I3842_10G032800 [Carya illinoinensis]|uniref:Insulin-degrading enzyme-like 1, peroxisomal n=1 Tax=Carya illinoinensis TaxID=32201 RepID=A0A922J1H6_CARIL|nr:hypothetical protein I3842_10G032800 [Carya illinoinensis]